MTTPFRMMQTGEPIDGNSPVFSTTRNNILTQVAMGFAGIVGPGAGTPIGSGETTGGGGGGVPCRIYDGIEGGGVDGLKYKPTGKVRVMLEGWNPTEAEWTVDTGAVIEAYPLHAGELSVEPNSAGGCCSSGPSATPAGLVLNWSKGIVYDPDAAAWAVTGTAEADSEVEVWLDAGTAVAATVGPTGAWTASLNLTSATRGVHTISAREKFFGDAGWQSTRSHAVWREDAEADPALRKAVAPRPLDAVTPDVQDASDTGASNNDNRTSDLSPVIDCSIADPGAFTTHYGRLYVSKAGTTVYHDEQDNNDLGAPATAAGDVFAFNTGTDGTGSASDFADGDVCWVQVDFWGIGGTALELDTDDVHSGMSRPMLLRIDGEETGEGSPTRYHLRGVLLQTGDDYHVWTPFGCLDPNTDEENAALDAEA